LSGIYKSVTSQIPSKVTNCNCERNQTVFITMIWIDIKVNENFLHFLKFMFHHHRTPILNNLRNDLDYKLLFFTWTFPY